MALNTINGKQLREKVVTNSHIADNAAIAESKLNVNWSSHYQAALQTKKVVDYVQFSNLAVTVGNGSVEIAKGADLGQISNTVAATNTDYGVATNYSVILRDRATGDPVVVNNKEVWGKIEFAAGDPEATPTPTVDRYIISFYTGEFGGTETAVNVPTGIANIDLQYACRFDLSSIPENFAANEKFVDGMVDVTEINNLKQLAKDLYGSNWALDNDGVANLSTSIKDEIARIDGAATTTGSIAYVVKTNALDKLASVASGEGATLIGLVDAGNKFEATNVEGALAELAGRIGSVESGGGAEVESLHTRSAATTNNVFAAKSFDAAIDRINEIESVIDTKAKLLADTITDYASTAENKGASLIGIKDANNQFTGTTVEAALDEALDAAQAAQSDATAALNDAAKLVTLSGVAAEAENLGTFTGTTIADNKTIKEALQALETAVEGSAGAASAAQGDATAALNDAAKLVTLSGVAAESENLGTFTGSTIADNKTIKEALQALETQLETTDGIADTNATWILNNGAKVHTHAEEVAAISEDTTTYTLVNTNIKSTDFMAVYINGIRQLPLTHYTTTVTEGKIVSITIADTLTAGDNIYLEFSIYNS